MKIDYDKIADVLYIAIKDRPGIADEVSSGNFIRYGAGDGEIVGITVLDFNERFMDFKKRFTGPPVAENPFRTAVLEVQNGILDPPDTGDLPHHKRMEQICDNITEEVDRRMIVKKYYSRRSAIHEVMMEVGTKVYSEPWKEGG